MFIGVKLHLSDPSPDWIGLTNAAEDADFQAIRRLIGQSQAHNVLQYGQKFGGETTTSMLRKSLDL